MTSTVHNLLRQARNLNGKSRLWTIIRNFVQSFPVSSISPDFGVKIVDNLWWGRGDDHPTYGVKGHLHA